MNDIEKHIKVVNEKLLQLLKHYAALKKENNTLKGELDLYKEKEIEYKFALHELDQKVSILKAASGQMSGNEQKDFEKRINQYIKEIDKCIAILSD